MSGDLQHRKEEEYLLQGADNDLFDSQVGSERWNLTISVQALVTPADYTISVGHSAQDNAVTFIKLDVQTMQ